MKCEKTTPGNPNRLTKNQHYHSRYCIEKFLNSNNRIEVFIHKNVEIKQLTPEAELFCAMRMWDQRAESGFMLSIENAFHEEIDNPKEISERNHVAITEYWALWKLRFEFFYGDHSEDTSLIGVTGDNLTKPQEENIESKHAVFVRDGGIIPARFSNGIRIQQGIDMISASNSTVTWGLLTSTNGEFIVSDNYSELQILPISPTQIFAANHSDFHISKDSLININQESISASKKLYFARSLASCPGITDTTFPI